MISLILFLSGWLVFSQFIPQYYIPVLPFLLMFFVVTTVLFHAYQLQLAKKDMAKFTRSTMLISFLKLFLYSIFAVIYIALDTENAVVFVICLMLFYIVFTTFEVISITRITSKK
jgi:hypothetical protein